jgi:diguanylate cyclase (GGDEF)-like protein
LFPREHRLPVALISEHPELATPTARRLRRSRRLDVVPVDIESLRNGDGWRRHGWLEGSPVAAVLTIGAAEDAHRQLVAEVVQIVAPVPLLVVTPTGGDTSLAMLEAGAEEVLSLHDSTSAALERAVLSAIYRRAADQRSVQRPSDPLTGLATRAVLASELPETLRAGGVRVAVLYCDLDKFKVVNDTHGHATGDLLLVEAAVRLRAAVRASDLVVRIGGDEFVVVLVGAGARFDDLADEVAARIVEAFRSPFELGEQSFSVSVSVGLATHRPGEEADSLLARADRALYLAKRRGKSRVARYDKSLDRAAAQHATSAEVLREGLRRDVLGVEVQPVVDPRESRMVGHVHRPVWGEAPELVGRAVPTQSVGSVARDSGSGPALFRWILRRTLTDPTGAELGGGGARRWVDMPRSVLVGSPGRALDPFVGERSGGVDQLIVLLEEDDLGDSAALRSGLLELARRGVRTAVSRFGASTGSLSLLERHPFEAVWVDRQMVDGLAGCPIRRAKLTAIGHVAGALGQQVLVDRPRRSEDLRIATGLVPVLVVDRSVDLTLGTEAVAPARAVAPDALRMLPHG